MKLGEMGKLNFYLIPGMGADRRIYSKFNLKNGVIHYLDWQSPKGAVDMPTFAMEVAKRITTENNIIIGSSMGGMMAVELSRIVKPLATILISAPVGVHQFPRILKAVKASRIHRAVSPKSIKYFYKFADTFMGFKSQQQRDMFYQMISELGPQFVHFSVRAVLEWKNTIPPHGNYIQIIGSKDVLFDYKKMESPIVLEGGGHFSCFDRADEVCEIINKYMENEILKFDVTN